VSNDLPMPGSSNAYFQEAFEICKVLLKSLRLSKQLDGVVDQDHIPLAEVRSLPTYSATDPRSSDLYALMERFRLALSVVDGLRGAMLQAESEKTDQLILIRWGSARAKAFVAAVQRQALPRAFMSAWKGKSEILTDLSRFLNHCIYDSEEEISLEAARYAAERHAGVIFFLAVFPNIPLIIPTLEIRMLVTKPLLGIAKSAHAIFGQFFLIGYFLYWIVLFARLFDAIPRVQVRVVQRLTIHRWLKNERKRLDLIRRYLREAESRIAKPRADAFVRGLLSIVQ
jgi:hypothetical protein